MVSDGGSSGYGGSGGKGEGSGGAGGSDDGSNAELQMEGSGGSFRELKMRERGERWERKDIILRYIILMSKRGK